MKGQEKQQPEGNGDDGVRDGRLGLLRRVHKGALDRHQESHGQQKLDRGEQDASDRIGHPQAPGGEGEDQERNGHKQRRHRIDAAREVQWTNRDGRRAAGSDLHAGGEVHLTSVLIVNDRGLIAPARSVDHHAGEVLGEGSAEQREADDPLIGSFQGAHLRPRRDPQHRAITLFAGMVDRDALRGLGGQDQPAIGDLRREAAPEGQATRLARDASGRRATSVGFENVDQNRLVSGAQARDVVHPAHGEGLAVGGGEDQLGRRALAFRFSGRRNVAKVGAGLIQFDACRSPRAATADTGRSSG